MEKRYRNKIIIIIIIPVQEGAHVPCANNHLLVLLLILTAFKGKTESRGSLASFGFRMNFL